MAQRGLFGRFCNPHQKQVFRGFIHFLLWEFGYYNDPNPPERVPDGFVYPNCDGEHDSAKPHLRWVNHSTFYFDLHGKRILVDPIWNNRCSPLPFLGPKRYHPPVPSRREDLGTVDYLILSHNHYDHVDAKSVQHFFSESPHLKCIVPLKLKKWVKKLVPQAEVIELDWWESFTEGDFLFTATPAQHFSGRGLFDRNHSLWMGCIVESLKSGKSFYFAGDTGYNPHDFREIGERHPNLDLSVLPIGAYLPRRFMRSVHISPEEAVKIHKEVGADLSVGGHWGTFRLSGEPFDRPPYDLFLALKEQQVPIETFRVLKPGQQINW